MITKEEFEQSCKTNEFSAEAFYDMYKELRDKNKQELSFNEFNHHFNLYLTLIEQDKKSIVFDKLIKHYNKKFNITN
jgi:hypothetical protein